MSLNMGWRLVRKHEPQFAYMYVILEKKSWKIVGCAMGMELGSPHTPILLTTYFISISIPLPNVRGEPAVLYK